MKHPTAAQGFFPAFEKTLTLIIKAICYAVLCIGLLLTVFTAMEVFSRYALNSSLVFVEELSRFLLIWFSYLGAVLALHESGHVGVDFLKQWLGDSLAGKMLRLFNIMVMTLFLGAMLYGTIRMMPVLRTQMATTLNITMMTPYLSITVGSFFMLVRIAYSLACLFTGRKENLPTITQMLSTGDEDQSTGTISELEKLDTLVETSK